MVLQLQVDAHLVRAMILALSMNVVALVSVRHTNFAFDASHVYNSKLTGLILCFVLATRQIVDAT